MTSGSFHSVETSTIVVNRAERQRRDLDKIPELAESMQKNGLINPVLITRELVLVAGERRLAAAQLLGWTHIACQFQDEVPLEQLRVLELEENIRRVDLPWQDRIRAVSEYHALRRADDSSWRVSDTARALNVTEQDIYEKLRVAEEIKTNPQIAEAPRYSIAKNFTARKAERARAEEDRLLVEPTAEPSVILNASFIDWAKTYDGPRFNLIHCDFPYGVGMQKTDQAVGARLSLGTYEDTSDVYGALISALITNIERIADEQCHLIFWFSMNTYEYTRDALSAEFSINPFPLVWLKSDGAGIIPDPQRGPRRVYETAFLGSRGDRKIVRAVPNGISSPRGRAQHLSEKSLPVVGHFLSMLVDGSTTLLDPTCGSATALRAAHKLGAARVLGIELNGDYAKLAADEWARALVEDNDAD